MRNRHRRREVDLGLAITEDVDVGRLVVVGEDDHRQAVGTQYSDHTNR